MTELRDLTEKAERFLRTAEQAMGIQDHDSCVSRCYYAMFFMAEAALLTRNLSSSSHRGVISPFGQHFVKTGIFDRLLGKTLNDAYDKRLIGDYGIGIAVTQNEAQRLLEAARDFVEKVKAYLSTWTEG